MLGTHGSLPFLLIVAFLCIGNMWLLVECKRKVPGVKTYGEVGLYALGRRGEVIIEVFLTLSQFSICCVYISFISNGIAPLLGLSGIAVIGLLLFPISYISLYRHMRDLAPLSIIASALLMCALLIIGFVCVEKLSHHGIPNNMPVFESSKVILFLGTVCNNISVMLDLDLTRFVTHVILCVCFICMNKYDSLYRVRI
jgi:hypothetical protein